MIIKKFKLYPDQHWVFFTVIIHHNKTSMRKAIGPGNERTLGICKGFHTIRIPPGRPRKWYRFGRPEIGEIHLCSKHGSIGIATHEICHAVHRYLDLRSQTNATKTIKRNFLKVDGYAGEKEESFCWLMGEMVRQFCVNFHSENQEPIRKYNLLNPIRRTTKVKA